MMAVLPCRLAESVRPGLCGLLRGPIAAPAANALGLRARKWCREDQALLDSIRGATSIFRLDQNSLPVPLKF
jgi:hypothetical protein